MEKRIFAAVLISIALLWLWAAVGPKLFPDMAKKPAPAKPAVTTTTGTTGTTAPIAPTGATTTTTTTAPSQPATVAAAPATPPVTAAAITVSTIRRPNYVAQLSNRGAQLVSFKLEHYTDTSGAKVELVKGRESSRTDFPFAIESADPVLMQQANSALYEVSERNEGGAHVIEYRWSDGHISVTKTFRFTAEYLFDYAVTVTPPAPYRVAIGPGIRTLAKEEKDSQFIITGNGVAQVEDDLKIVRREKSDRVNIWPAAQYVGVEDNYFLTVLRGDKPRGAVIRTVEFPADNKQTRRELYAGLNAANGVVAGNAFFGPKETKTLDGYGLEKTLQFGMFGVVARVLLIGMQWINKTTHNYGFAIIVITFIIRVLLYPLQHKWIVSMKKMQKLQPKQEAIKARYKKAKTDPEQRQKMNQEIMKLYQAEGVNPAGGCLPFALQIPILWGFYNLLTHAIELRHAPFMLWIHDLSAKDPYYITPILMVVTMFIQQAMTPATGDATQRRMFYIMPVVMGWIFKELPSGVVIYYLMQNVLTILQQWIMNKWWKDHPDDKSGS